MEARDHGETTVQLQETERYEYEVNSADHTDLRLRCGLSTRRKSLRANAPDAGLIETRSFCGTLLLDLVEGEVNDTKPAVASAIIDVRSIKLHYRTEYRGMLRRVSDEMAGLAADARSSTKMGLRSSFKDQTDQGWLQIQLELLRDTLDSAEFGAALQHIISFPHQRSMTASEAVNTDRPIQWTSSAIRQLITRTPRRPSPPGLQSDLPPGMESIAARVILQRRSHGLDTPENRFVKYVLMRFNAFLWHARDIFAASRGWGAPEALARRLTATIEEWLDRGFFREVREMTFTPLGSIVLQRKAGYRELLQWWLRFRSAAELSWSGGEGLFHAGQRDVATLYEYWLFFELLGWFCRKCRDGVRPTTEELVDGLDDGSPNLRLRRQVEIGPFVGTFAGENRRLNARFSYNRLFTVTGERQQAGSWTRRLRPDYTLTFWPEGFSEAEAEQNELLVHAHFDAKYRIEDIEALFGGRDTDDTDDEAGGNYKRHDLLKMHAYRDAIKRSQGAYVLYPGRSNKTVIFQGFHEILPGLGAFGIVPNEDGASHGMDALADFLDEMLSHLGNRTTARERAGYHLAVAYRSNESPVPYGDLRLSEKDVHGGRYRSLPPEEHLVLIAWIQDEARMRLATADNGGILVRLDHQDGGPYVHPDLARVRQIALRTHDDLVAPGLLSLREPGFRVFTGTGLRRMLRQAFGARGVEAWTAICHENGENEIHAFFQTQPDVVYDGTAWSGALIKDLLKEFELDARNRLMTNPGQSLDCPRVISLRSLLKARVSV